MMMVVLLAGATAAGLILAFYAAFSGLEWICDKYAIPPSWIGYAILFALVWLAFGLVFYDVVDASQ